MSVKAGGMRIVTKHRAKDQDSDAYDEKYKDTVNSIGPAVKWVVLSREGDHTHTHTRPQVLALCKRFIKTTLFIIVIM